MIAICVGCCESNPANGQICRTSNGPQNRIYIIHATAALLQCRDFCRSWLRRRTSDGPAVPPLVRFCSTPFPTLAHTSPGKSSFRVVIVFVPSESPLER